jgi:hypothetical protein
MDCTMVGQACRDGWGWRTAVARETYVLHIYRSRALRGWQWAARLDHLPDQGSLRFTDPEALLAHLASVVQAGDQPTAPLDAPPGADVPPPATAEEGSEHEEERQR